VNLVKVAVSIAEALFVSTAMLDAGSATMPSAPLAPGPTFAIWRDVAIAAAVATTTGIPPIAVARLIATSATQNWGFEDPSMIA
jgi:hypothetical protein